MFSDFFEPLRIILFSMFILFSLVEAILSGTWNKMYFTFGLPIFVKRISVGFRRSNIPLPSQFEAQFQSAWTSSLVFRGIAQNTIGFREKIFEFRLLGYTPLMHGVLLFDSANNQVVVKGFANWFNLGFSVIWLGSVGLMAVMNFPEASLNSLAFLMFFFIVMGLLYWIQHYRFSKVAAFAAQEWQSSTF